jgi:hypothetical protein
MDDPLAGYDREGYARKLEFWVEGELSSSILLDMDAGLAEYLSLESGSPEGERRHRIWEFTPRIWWYSEGSRNLDDRSIRGVDDLQDAGTVSPFQGGPYRPHGRRLGICAGFQLRGERSDEEGEGMGDFTKNEILPFALLKYRLSRTHVVEAGYLADRYDAERTGEAQDSDKRWENRIKLSWELRFGDENLIRVIETIDLDREDWGQFSIHDHFFLMTHISF